MSQNVLSSGTIDWDQAAFLGSLASEPQKHLDNVTARIISGASWSPPPNIQAVWPVTRSGKGTRRQRKAKRAKLTGATREQPYVVLTVKDFDLSLETTITSFRIDRSSVNVHSTLDPDVALLLTFETQREENSDNLQIAAVSIRLEVSKHSPRAHFVESSLYAILSLSSSINISLPDLKVNVDTNFQLSLSQITQLLQSRQTYYGLMVIEKSIARKLKVPEYITAEEMANTSFVYHCITQRTFEWIANSITIPVPATQQILSWFDTLNPIEPGGSIYKMMFGPTPVTRSIFGVAINLGQEIVWVDDAFLIDHDRIRNELTVLDGHEVSIVFRPVRGIAKYSVADAPLLPSEPWDREVKRFINLDDLINCRLARKFNELAFGTLKDLSPEESISATTRPTIEYPDEDNTSVTDVIE